MSVHTLTLTSSSPDGYLDRAIDDLPVVVFTFDDVQYSVNAPDPALYWTGSFTAIRTDDGILVYFDVEEYDYDENMYVPSSWSEYATPVGQR